MEIHSERAKELLGKYLPFYVALDSGKRQPATKGQQHFVDVCKGNVEAQTDHEIAYMAHKAQALSCLEVNESGKKKGKSGFVNTFLRWKEKDEEELRGSYARGASIRDLSQKLQRTEKAIVLRLVLLGAVTCGHCHNVIKKDEELQILETDQVSNLFHRNCLSQNKSNEVCDICFEPIASAKELVELVENRFAHTSCLEDQGENEASENDDDGYTFLEERGSLGYWWEEFNRDGGLADQD